MSSHTHTRTHPCTCTHTPSHRDALTGSSPGLVLALPLAGCVNLCHFLWTSVSPPAAIRVIIDLGDAFWLLQFGIRFFLSQPLPSSFKRRLAENIKPGRGRPGGFMR